MQILKTLTLKILAISMFVISTLLPTNAQEIENGTFSGTINTTVSSGLSFRTERDCSNLDGFTFTSALGTYVDGSGKGCGTALTDDYGNTTTKVLSRNAGQTDDGSMNYDKGDIFSTTQKLTSQIVGSLSSGVGVNLSFTGFIDPNVDTTNYAPLSNKSKNLMERGLSLLDAYITTETQLPSGEYIDWTIGRQVTNWGEATFIPVGMNGLTTNSLDLSKLRRPGSSIREALMPTEQITMSTYLGEGINLEAFYQFSDEAVQLDAAGSFFGNEVVGPGSSKMITSANYKYELTGPDSCPYSLTADDETLCNAAMVATANSDAGIAANAIQHTLTTGLMGLTQTELATGSGAGATKVWGTNFDGETTDLTTVEAAKWSDAYTNTLNTLLGSKTASGVLAGGAAIQGDGSGGVDKTFYTTNTVGYELATNAGTLKTSYIGLGDTTGASLYAAMQALDANSLIQDVNSTYATVSIRRADDFVKEARSDGQFGLKMSGYSDAGTGLDWSLNYSRFHSKAPYVRVIGKGGVYAGDMYGIFTSARATAEGSRSAAQAAIVKTLGNVAYGGGVCNAKMSAALSAGTFAAADTTGEFWNAAQKVDGSDYDGTIGKYSAFTMSSQQKSLYDQYAWQQVVNGNLVHNSAKCYDSATYLNGVIDAQVADGRVDTDVDYHEELYKGAEILLAALTPLNSAKYELIHPEDLNAFGASFNTNINGTTVQGEFTYRPDFPLATNVGDQVAQIGDVTGAFDTLDLFVYETVAQFGNSNTTNDSAALAVADGEVSPNFYSAAREATMTATEIAQQRVRMYMIGAATLDSGTGAITVNRTTIPSAGLATYLKWQGSQNSGHAQTLGIAGIRKAVFDLAYVGACQLAGAGAGETAATCQADTLGNGDYNTNYYTGATFGNTVGGAYEFGMLGFNRSSLPAIAQTATTADYYSTPFIEKDVYSFDLGTTTLFNASHPINTAIGSDSSVLLTEVAVVHINGMNNASDGYISRGGYQEGIGNEKCLGAFGSNFGGHTLGATAGLTHLGAGIVDGLFGNGKYCEDQSGADQTSLSYRVIGSATYNNFNNSSWSLSPSVVWSHDPMGYGPSSLGGFVEDRMSMSLGLSARKGASISASVNYSSNLAGPEIDTSSDRDFVSMSMSYSF
jgi:hypothetical protein